MATRKNLKSKAAKVKAAKNPAALAGSMSHSISQTIVVPPGTTEVNLRIVFARGQTLAMLGGRPTIVPDPDDGP